MQNSGLASKGPLRCSFLLFAVLGPVCPIPGVSPVLRSRLFARADSMSSLTLIPEIARAGFAPSCPWVLVSPQCPTSVPLSHPCLLFLPTFDEAKTWVGRGEMCVWGGNPE